MTCRRLMALLLLLGVFSWAFVGCADDDDDGDDLLIPEGDVVATCEGCHTSETMLKATALPDPPPSESEGEG